jgi:predicted site-specific integrase-resolvase
MGSPKQLQIAIGEAATRLGVSIQTLRAWDASGAFVPEMRTVGGQRRYSVAQINAKAGSTPSSLTIGYCRVSSKKQEADLVRQIEVVTSACAKFGEYRVLSDIGSGMNYNKSGLKALLDILIDGACSRLVIADKDRLLRFGAELVFAVCAIKGVQVVILNADPHASFEEDLARDVLEIVTVFSARLYGGRSKRNRKLIEDLRKSIETS